jgi:acylphosphatase
VRAIVTGRVQGVSYRASAASAARGYAIVGWARNRRDGTVELEAEGPDDRVTAFLAWCAEGPPAAHVAGVDVEELAPLGSETSFTIRATG